MKFFNSKFWRFVSIIDISFLFIFSLFFSQSIVNYSSDELITPSINNTLKEKTFRTPYYSVYVNYWAVASKSFRTSLIEKSKQGIINSFVIDVKNEYGEIFYKSNIPLAISIGAQNKSYIKNGKTLLASYKQANKYTIARLSIFKDHLLANKHPEWAIKNMDGTLWKDGMGLSWTDPHIDEIIYYNIRIIEDIAKMGFDEIHLDYARFPGKNSLIYKKKNNKKNRIDAISYFLKRVKERLKPLPIKLSIATFGYTCWNNGDTAIGHDINELAKHVDYICPMLYPSSFHLGIPNYAFAISYPFEIVFNSLNRCRDKSGLPSWRFRPWLQAFDDYGFDGRKVTDKYIAKQILAAQKFESSGWMLWNPASRYNMSSLNHTMLVEDNINDY